MNGTIDATANGAVEAFNATLNATAAATSSPQGNWLLSTFLPVTAERFLQLVAAPFQHPQMVYILTPMLITLVLMEFYFGRYKDEELGWNTAVGHALVLIFVGIDLLKTVYPGVPPSVMAAEAWAVMGSFSSFTGEALTTLIALAILLFGFLLLIVDFFHWLPKGLAFFVSGTLEIDLIAYLGIVIVYSNNARLHPIPVDWYTLLAAILLFFALSLLFGFIHLLEPEYKGKRKEIRKLAAEAPAPREPDVPLTSFKE